MSDTTLPSLEEDIAEAIDDLSEQGNEAEEAGDLDAALTAWEEALALIPEPRNAYVESVWLLASIGDVYFQREDYADALEFYESARGNLSGEGATNPFVLLRLGQCYLEGGDEEQAKEHLLKAYMLEGEELFEEEDGKYLDFLGAHVDLDA